MADNSWDTYTPDAPRRGRAWGKVFAVLGGIVLVVTVLVSALGIAANKSRVSAWPLVKKLANRLQTDQGAKELYGKNPSLVNSYPTEEAFVDRVREFREGLKLPENPPNEGPDEFRVFSSPFDLRVRVKGEGGAWMEVGVDLGGPFRPAPAGEGIFRLNFGKDMRELRRQTQMAMERQSARSWGRFVEVARTLAKEGGLEELSRGSPGLRTVPADRGAFAILARQRREALLAIPEASMARGPSNIRSRNTPFSRSVEVEATLKDGGKLKALWKSDALEIVELR